MWKKKYFLKKLFFQIFKNFKFFLIWSQKCAIGYPSETKWVSDCIRRDKALQTAGNDSYCSGDLSWKYEWKLHEVGFLMQLYHGPTQAVRERWKRSTYFKFLTKSGLFDPTRGALSLKLWGNEVLMNRMMLSAGFHEKISSFGFFPVTIFKKFCSRRGIFPANRSPHGLRSH